MGEDFGSQTDPSQFDAANLDDLREEEVEEGDEEYEDDNGSEIRLHIPRQLVWGCVGVLSAACIIGSIVAFAYGSGGVGGEVPINLSPCLVPIRATLTAAGASQAVGWRLEAAARPGIFDSDVLPLLLEAERLLEPMRDNAAVVPALQALTDVIALGNCP